MPLATLTLDNPRVRRLTRCVLCNGPKDIGLVACWNCFRRYDMRNGNPVCEEIIAEHEHSLRGAQR